MNGLLLKECLSKVDRLGWDETSSLYIAVQEIICAGESYRRSWMKLSEDNNLKTEAWVKTIGKPLGYLIDQEALYLVLVMK